jgi:hypothetical protein
MTLFSTRPAAAIALALVAGIPSAASACATCGCTLSSDAATGFSTTSGWRLSFQYDYIDQDTLRSGTRSANPSQVVDAPSDPALGGGEIEHQTVNRYLTVGVSYSPDADWRFDLRVPYIERDHSTYGQQQQPYTPADTAPSQLSTGHLAGLGDIKLLANYQGFLPTHNLGIQIGIKLPTGAYGTAINFDSGPAAGTPVDASLQPGTGSTDIIVGAYYHTAISQDFDVFASAQFQSAMQHAPNQPGNDYRPGNSETVSFGIRYEDDPRIVPAVQLNLYHKSADQGALADTTDTAGTVAYLSPGVTARITPHVHVFGFVQVPVYSNLDGYQLFPHWTASAGVSYGF